MQKAIDASQIVSNDLVRQGHFVAQRISDGLNWGVGGIQPSTMFATDQDQMNLIICVLENLEQVDAAERPFSSCTDGRIPVKLLSGEPVPVREQEVGCDIMLLFHMAEALGARFYKDAGAPLADRLQEVAEFMQHNGLAPSTHKACGAAINFVAILQNLLDFTASPQFAERQKALLPQAVYSDELRDELTAGYRDRLQRGVYDSWSDALVTDIVQHLSGDRAIAELNDDGRGVHGHVEEQIIRIKIDGVAIDEAAVTSRTHGREVFGVNDLRLERLARLLGRGRDSDYRLALMAAEDFTDGAHGTLAKNLPTYVITTT